MQISQSLKNIFDEIVNEARKRKNEYITIDHAFYILLKHKPIRKILEDVGVDVDYIRRGLDFYLDRYVQKSYFDVSPIETIAFSNATDRMFKHIKGIKKPFADEIDFFISLLEDETSYTVQLLKEFGIEKVEIVEYVVETKEEKKQKKNLLHEYTQELVSIADKFDDVIGREKEIKRIIQILARRKKNNPILVGEPGVGKSAIVEGLAKKIAKNEVPKELIGKKNICFRYW